MKAFLLSMLVISADYAWAGAKTQPDEMLANKYVNKKKSKFKHRRSSKKYSKRYSKPRPLIFRLLYMPSYRFLSNNIENESESGQRQPTSILSRGVLKVI